MKIINTFVGRFSFAMCTGSSTPRRSLTQWLERPPSVREVIGSHSCRELRLFLCPTLESCWSVYLSHLMTELNFTIFIHLSMPNQFLPQIFITSGMQVSSSWESRLTKNTIPTGTVWPDINWGVPLINRPILGPTTIAPTKATAPPRAWTTPLPAKS